MIGRCKKWKIVSAALVHNSNDVCDGTVKTWGVLGCKDRRRFKSDESKLIVAWHSPILK